MDGALLAVLGCPLDRPDLVELARSLASRLGHPLAVVSTADPVTGLRTLLGQGARRVVVLPLLLDLGQSAPGLEPLIRLCSQRWPFLAFHLARPLSWLEWAELIRGAVGAEPALVLEATSSGDPLADANLARLAWLVAQGGPARVAAGFREGASPSVETCVAEALALGLDPVRVLGWPGLYPGLAEQLQERYAEALQDDSLQRPVWSEVAARVAVDEEAELADLERRIQAMLPPETQDSQPMGAASLLVDEQGEVAWDKMWQSFCELALAGGPAHRGTLLEAVSAPAALAEPERYQKVVEEIERGLRLVTALPPVRSASPGWVGLRCDSEAMALWLMRAIIVENVMVRREDEVIYLPAGPAFRLEHEIKNVVTVVAKTFHYWCAHKGVRTA